MTDELLKQLKQDEGFRAKPYKDTVGKLTVGYGRNLDDVGISEPEASQLLWNDANIACRTLAVEFPWTQSLSVARRGVLENMCFNMGIASLKYFSKMLECVQNGRYEAAAIEMENSKWYGQVGNRAKRLVKQMRTDTWQYQEGI